jgi:uncharacterized protein YegL
MSAVEDTQYRRNPSQRTPCILVLDASGSMEAVVAATGKTRIQEINDGLRQLYSELDADETARMRVQLAIVCVGGPAGDVADLLMGWTDVMDFVPPTLVASGLTPLGHGLEIALKTLREHKNTLRQSGIGYTRPWMMVMTDGEPTDKDAQWQAAVQACRGAEAAKECTIFPLGAGEANMSKLQEISTTEALPMRDRNYKEFFHWLSSSLSTQSRSQPGGNVQLGPVSPWANVKN